MFYRHFDLRSFNPHQRVPYDIHLIDALDARKQNASVEDRQQNSRRKSKPARKKVNGIEDIWCFDRLPYADISKQVTWPFVHAISGVIKLLSGIIMGVLPDTAATNKRSGLKRKSIKGNAKGQGQQSLPFKDAQPYDDDCDDENEDNDGDCFDGTDVGKASNTLSAQEKHAIFNSYRKWNMGEKAPYEASKNDISRCREWLQCILLPPGLDDDSYSMKGFLLPDGKLGYMKMNQRLKLISSFWEIIILSMRDLVDQYRLFIE